MHSVSYNQVAKKRKIQSTWTLLQPSRQKKKKVRTLNLNHLQSIKSTNWAHVFHLYLLADLAADWMMET
jgi:hypothetical protein